MPTDRNRIQCELDKLLEPQRFRDYCPNGLQVEGKAEINKIVSGVTASQDMIEAAIDAGADMLLVHHGYFWKGEDAAICGIKKRRIARLLQADLNLFAYHLPLDAHPELGNNAQLASVLGFSVEQRLANPGESPLLFCGKPESVLDHESMLAHLQSRLGRAAMGIKGSDKAIEKVAWCTGAAQGYIDLAIAAGADAFISGEVSEQTYHSARESGIHYFAAGHHATERYGVQATGKYLAEKFDLEHQFIDIHNPV